MNKEKLWYYWSGFHSPVLSTYFISFRIFYKSKYFRFCSKCLSSVEELNILSVFFNSNPPHSHLHRSSFTSGRFSSGGLSSVEELFALHFVSQRVLVLGCHGSLSGALKFAPLGALLVVGSLHVIDAVVTISAVFRGKKRKGYSNYGFVVTIIYNMRVIYFNNYFHEILTYSYRNLLMNF